VDLAKTAERAINASGPKTSKDRGPSESSRMLLLLDRFDLTLEIGKADLVVGIVV
jgi:hypothetical protein